MWFNNSTFNSIVLLDQKTPLWGIFNNSDIYTPFDKFPTIEQLNNAKSIVVLAELIMKCTYRSNCEGLSLIRELRFWNKATCPIVIISFLSKDYLISRPEGERLFKLADDYIQLPTSILELEKIEHTKEVDLNNKFNNFCYNNVNCELIKLLGTHNHPSPFYRTLNSLYISPDPQDNHRFLNMLDSFAFMLRLKEENNIDHLMNQIKNVESYYRKEIINKPSVEKIKYWVENILWRKE